MSSQPSDKDKVSQAKSDAISSIVSAKMNDYKIIRNAIDTWCHTHYSLNASMQHELAILIMQDPNTDIKSATAKQLLIKETEDLPDFLTS